MHICINSDKFYIIVLHIKHDFHFFSASVAVWGKWPAARPELQQSSHYIGGSQQSDCRWALHFTVECKCFLLKQI